MEPLSFSNTLTRATYNLSGQLSSYSSLSAMCRAICQKLLDEEEFWYFDDHILDDLTVTINSEINATSTIVLCSIALRPYLSFEMPAGMMHLPAQTQRELFLQCLTELGVTNTP